MTTPDEVVVDSSVIIALVTLEERSDWAEQKMSEHDYFHVLDLNYYEVANAIKCKISNKFPSKDARAAWSEAVKLMNLSALHSFSEIIDDAFAVASDLGITVYDAAFLSLADRLDAPFLTLDVTLAKKLENTKYYRLLECPK
jgi:predicted nucleic acid-binding protein